MSVIFTRAPQTGGVNDHGSLIGLTDDDHTQYILVNGSRGFTSTVAGVLPTDPNHLVTKEYADTLSGTGQTNTASNLGSGEGIFYQKIGVDLQFKSLIGGDNIILSSDNGTITISGTSGGGTSDHSLLSNLDYASSGHIGFQPTGDYITSIQLTTTSGDIVSQIPIDYYTQAEITTISGGIVAQIPTDFYTQSEVDTISGVLDAEKSDVDHTHTESDIIDLGDYASTTQLTTISGDIVSQIVTDHGALDGLLDNDHPQYLLTADFTTASGDIINQIPADYLTGAEITTISGDIVNQFPTDFYSQAEIITISGDLQTNIDAKPDTLLDLIDTPLTYDNNKYLKSTSSGTEWATISGGTGTSNHSELTELDYASAGHTGFAPTVHNHVESDITDIDHDAVKIQGREVSSDIPLDTQVLSWSDSSSQWEPNYQIGGSVNLDGGRADTNYGGVPLTDGGGASSF